MQGILFEEPTVLEFAFVTVLMGGWTAWRTGKSAAEGWSGYGTLVIYTLLLGVAIRFIHHALFNGSMLTLQFYTVDTVILLLFATAGYRYLPYEADDQKLLLALREGFALFVEGKTIEGIPAPALQNADDG